jgi:hypothetical protein
MVMRAGHPKACQCFSEEPILRLGPRYRTLLRCCSMPTSSQREQASTRANVAVIARRGVAVLRCPWTLHSTLHWRFLPINISLPISYRTDVTSCPQQTCFLHSVQRVNLFAATSADVRRLACVHSLTCHVAEHAAAERLSPRHCVRCTLNHPPTFI